jgi:hypothetical protein
VRHQVPSKLDSPPEDWVFDAPAKECGLVMKMEEGFEVVGEFAGALKI